MKPGELADEQVREQELSFRMQQLQDERPLGHVGVDHARDDETVERLDEPAHELGVVRLLEEVELRAEMQLELLRELFKLHPLPRSFCQICVRKTSASAGLR